MKLYYEWGTKQLHKHGEELCGDSVAVSRHADSVTLALSDGLGSGVKANISATLTTRIAMHMLENGLPLSEVVKTLGETLPVCRVRKLAYSTFAIAQFFREGYAKVVEFDTPSAMLLRHNRIQPIVYDERSVDGKTVRESVVDINTGDWMVFVSDGVLNAGIGGVYPLGWGWEAAAHFLQEQAHEDLSAENLADKIAQTVGELYADAPGDDVSIVVIKARRKHVLTVLTGPPAEKDNDEDVVNRFIRRAGRHVICGGTTANLAARHLGRPMDVDLNTMTQDVPPQARMKGVDLITEGILTLTAASELLKSGTQKRNLIYRADGASELARMFLEADHVHFLVGQAVNPAHQNPELPRQLEMRHAVVREIAEELQKRGMEATVESV